MSKLLWILCRPRYCWRIWRLYGIPPWQTYAEVMEMRELGREMVELGESLQRMVSRRRRM